MAMLRIRVTGSEDDVRIISKTLQQIDGISHVEEVDYLMPHMDDADSSSAGLSDLRFPDTHELEIEVPDDEAAERVRDVVAELAIERNVAVEFERDEG